MTPKDPVPRQLGAILDVLGLKMDDLFGTAATAGENRNKVVAWLYRVLDTLDSKTGHMLSFPGLLLAAQTFLTGLIIKDRPVSRTVASILLGLLIVPLWTAVHGFYVYRVTWKFFGKVRASDQDTFNETRIEDELRSLAKTCDTRYEAHGKSFLWCAASALAFFMTLIFALAVVASGAPASGSWKFAVSGDSRNCGDIVMPAIAAGVRANGAEFYWHLGDFRAIYEFDEDMVPPAKLNPPSKPMNISDYLTNAWPDFIAHQMTPFRDLPVFLAIGNHETIPPATRNAWLIQFADWLENPLIRAQRLKDDPKDRTLHAYYHWVKGNVDFISLDNASEDQFDAVQLKWFHSLVQRDEGSGDIKTIVVGMHAALPGSVGRKHSMSDWPQGDKSGRDVYETLWHAQDSVHKRIYILASHSHFFMQDVYDTADWKNKVLPGWIVGTAGAVRYRIPPEAGSAQNAQTDVYGYMAATVAADGSISFDFQKLSVDKLLAANHGAYPEPLVRWCDTENKQ